MIAKSTSAIIFDLGGVIINLDTPLTISAFALLTQQPMEKIAHFAATHPIMHQYEKGEVSDEAFREAIRTLSDAPLTDQDIDDAWNAMILDLPPARLEFIKSLSTRYQVYLLSNTNTIHMKRVNDIRVEAQIDDFNTIFHQDYYSHLMGKRKPDADIFEQVLQENNLLADQTLFIDDNHDNIIGGRGVGLQTLHVTSPQQWIDYFNG